jgi:sodium/hydrogen exchanger 8
MSCPALSFTPLFISPQVIGVREDIFSIIFGESVLNDAVAIVLARTILAFNKPGAEVAQ